MITWLVAAVLSIAAAAPNVVVITLDTTRADALSCYGQPPDVRRELPPVTPHLDAMAAEGVRFERFYSHVPTTLASHASLMTGKDPHEHGVPRNGYPLDPSVPVLAERLDAAGYDTIAVVGAMALERAMGLARGFRIYDDTTPEQQDLMVQDRAEGVLQRTLAALARREADKPLFLWVHFYDPHAPYAAPGEWADRFVDPTYDGRFRTETFRRAALLAEVSRNTADPADLDYVASRYLGEVGYVDAQIGALVDELSRQGLLDHALVVVVGDHGETLSEHPGAAWSHGSTVTEEVVRVPLILRGYGVPLARRAVVGRQAEMAGLASTIEVAVGLEPTLGAPFWDLVRPGPVWDEDGWPARPTRTVLMEATRPRQLERANEWNNLRMWRRVLAGGYAFEKAPGLAKRGELEGGGPDVLESLCRELLDNWDARAPGYRPLTAGDATREGLRALGYLESGENDPPSSPDPSP